jgi:hypothetical protein
MSRQYPPPDAAGNCVHFGNNAAGAGVQKKYKAFFILLRKILDII